MMLTNSVTEQLKIAFPMIMAPMFLVSNEEMVKSAMDSGIMGTFPTLNFRHENELVEVLQHLNAHLQQTDSKGCYGVNLIVQKTNVYYQNHLRICVDNRVPFYITSLGNPKEVIVAAHAYGAKVYCDVTDLHFAEKCAALGCDGFIAVCKGAGGHAGPYSMQELLPLLHQEFPDIPTIAAGGIATGQNIAKALALGAQGVSIGTRFICSEEAKVSNDYKQAILHSTKEDIVLTTRLSGTPSNVINTEYVQRIGLKQNFIEHFLSNHPKTKKYFKMFVQFRGMKALEKAIIPGNYKNIWVAGTSVQDIHDIKPCSVLIHRLIEEYEQVVATK